MSGCATVCGMALRIPVDVPDDMDELAELIIQVGQEFEQVTREIGDSPPTPDQRDWFDGLSNEHARLTRIYTNRREATRLAGPTRGRPVY